MSLYLTRARMSADAMKALVAKPEDRTSAVRSALEAAGAKLLQMWYSASSGEVISVVEAPSLNAAWSYGTAVFISGAIEPGSFEELMTPAQFVESLKGAGSLVAKYRPPGK
ncbi:MAG TPA: GYD domain-containing protein [Burkholderiaceae bacterium]|nr:GYD domain-containing protein [Burkholderiaceae bacterium]